MILTLHNVCANNFDQSYVKVTVFFFMTCFLEKDLDKQIFVIFCVFGVCVQVGNFVLQGVKIVRSDFIELKLGNFANCFFVRSSVFEVRLSDLLLKFSLIFVQLSF